MKLRPLSVAGSILPLLLLLAAPGCNVIPPVQPDLTKYYVLSGGVLAETGAPATAGTLRLGLRPVEVAPYLRRGTMVVRAGDHEISFAESARWAEPLEREIGAALRQRLGAASSVARVLTPPFPAEPTRDFDVNIQVLRCEGVRENANRAVARFAASIEISTTGDNAQLIVRRTFVPPDAAWDGKDFGRLAALLSDAVAALSQEVVASLPEKK